MGKNVWEVPLRLMFNKIPRYPGGREIDRFRGQKEIKDDGRPEAWVGSTTRARTPNQEQDSNMGLSEVILPSGHVMLLKDLIDMHPKEILGEKHYTKFGDETCILVKLLDAKNQLGLQAHPSREYAKKHFNSEFGKVESWYIIGTREDQQELPYVLLGFKEGITRQIFEELYEQQDIKSMEELCHKIHVSPGDMFFVDAGMPHAVGPGCFMIEVQESSDITVGVRKRSFKSKEEEIQYKERLLGCYEYVGFSYEEILNGYKIPPKVVRCEEGGTETVLIGQAQTPYFGITETQVRDEFSLRDTSTFSIAIVIEGEGEIAYDGGIIDIKKGDEIFLPAGIKDPILRSKSNAPLKIVQSFPPEVIN